MLVCSESVGPRLVITPSSASIGSSSAVELISVMPSSASTLATAPISESVLRVASDKQHLGQPPVGLDAAEDLLVLDLSGHDGAGDAFALESLDQLRQLAQRQPMHRSRAVLLDLGEGLFLDGRDHDLHALRARRVQHEERKLAVAGDETDAFWSRSIRR